MTVPNGNILFNSSTGSNTAASGIGPATAISGTGASLNATSTVDLSADSPDLSGVTAGDLLWVGTSSGRQFSIIASADNTAKTVTCDDAFGVTESSRNWGIGGKRQTLAGSQRIYNDGVSSGDGKPGWTIELESGFTETHSGEIIIRIGGDTTSGPFSIVGDSSTPAVITNSDNSIGIRVKAAATQLKFLDLRNSHETKGQPAINIETAASSCLVYGVKVNDQTNNCHRAMLIQGDGCKVEYCHFANCVTFGIEFSGTSTLDMGYVRFCRIYNNGDSGLKIILERTPIIIENCLFYNNGVSGAEFDIGTNSYNVSGPVIRNSVFHSNTQDGIEFTSTDIRGYGSLIIEGNILTSNGGYGINLPAVSVALLGYMNASFNYNAFYNNTSGARNNLSAGSNDVTLTGDPFIDAANGDFNINNTSGAGAALRTVTVTL